MRDILYMPNFYRFLDIDKKMELLYLLSNDEEVIYKKNNISIIDWIQNMSTEEDISTRLYGCLRSLSGSRDWNESSERGILDLEKKDITNMRNAGEACWIEFEQLREKYKNSLKK